MIPDREGADRELKWAAGLNSGPWKEHSLYAAITRKSITSRCSHVDRDRAYTLGLLHDTGRYAGRTSERHLLDGRCRRIEHRWEEAARTYVSHAFIIQDIGVSIGEFGVTPQSYEFMKELIPGAVYDDYDRLVQLYDNLAPSTGFCPLETRFVDVAIRYGVRPGIISRWKRVLEVKDYFEEQMGRTIYETLPCGGRLQYL